MGATESPGRCHSEPGALPRAGRPLSLAWPGAAGPGVSLPARLTPPFRRVRGHAAGSTVGPPPPGPATTIHSTVTMITVRNIGQARPGLPKFSLLG
eukprot:350118-Hanusia_phi.AAC.1